MNDSKFEYNKNNNKFSDDKECAICLTNRVDTIVLPCKHMCSCSSCCEDLRKRARKCPICRNGNIL